VPPHDADRPERGSDTTKSGMKSVAKAATSHQAVSPITNSAVIRGLQSFNLMRLNLNARRSST
jgi:hypothetical protein